MLLRLINNPSDYQQTNLLIESYVQSRLESFVYKTEIDKENIALDFIASKDTNADFNISVVDRSGSISENQPIKSFSTNDFYSIKGTSFTSGYPDLLITDQYYNDTTGNIFPLFYGQDLPDLTVNVKFEKITTFEHKELTTQFIVSSDMKRVYYSFNNSYNLDTAYYELYYLIAITSDGKTTKSLISPSSAVREIVWTDTDPLTGELATTNSLFYKEQIGNQFTYYFNHSGNYYIKPEKSSYIKPLEFSNKLSDDGWFPRVSNGSFTHIDSTNTLYEYLIPEVSSSNFIPYYPYRFDSYSTYSLVTKNIIYLGRENIAINQTDLPLEIIIRDTYDNILYVLTTKTAKDGTSYNSSLKWSTKEIASWDNKNGLIELNLDLQPTWNLSISSYYEQKEYSLYSVNMNPIYNNLVYDHFYVVYIKPAPADPAVHYLLVRNDGVIVDTSDTDYQLFIDDVPNTNTFIGQYYRRSGTYSETDWESERTTSGVNNYQYFVLAEYFFVERISPNDLDSTETRIAGSSIDMDNLESIVKINPKLQQSFYAGGEYGIEYPKNSSVVCRISRSLIDTYGGDFTLDQIQENLYKYISASKYILFEYDEDIDSITIDNSLEGIINLTWYSVGNDYSYKIYRSFIKDSGFELIEELTASSYYQITWQDSGLETNKTYYYYIVPVKNSYDYPQSITIGAVVR